MTAAPVTVELGRLGDHQDRGPAGRLLYLPRLDAIVAVREPRNDGCRCLAIARRSPGKSLDEILVGQPDLATATTTFTLHAEDDDGYAMLWLTRVDQHDPDGVLPHLARRLAEDNRAGASRTVDLTVTMAGFDHSGPSGIVIAALRLHLRRMIADGFLGPGPGETIPTGWGPFTLTIPHAAATGSGASHAGRPARPPSRARHQS
jgi:hypothetical protein